MHIFASKRQKIERSLILTIPSATYVCPHCSEIRALCLMKYKKGENFMGFRILQKIWHFARSFH